MGDPTHAGTVVFRKNGDRTEYLIISSTDGSSWVLPKGHIEAGETARAAALRELQEEAGQVGEIVDTVSDIRYRKHDGEEATVRFFLARALRSIRAAENRSLRWEEAAAALRLLTFDDARDALRKAAEMVHRPGVE